MNPANYIFLDNHSTTRVDPRVVEAMLPIFESDYGNAGSVTHRFGERAADAVSNARATVAGLLNARPEEIVFTSGATESNNLAIFGLLEHRRNLRQVQGPAKIVSVSTEHHAVLDPLKRLEKRGLEVTLLPVFPQTHERVGQIDLEQLEREIDSSTILVSVMLANNEIGTVQPLEQVAEICRNRNCWLHTDATQAIGRLPVDVEKLGVDLLSLSGHKIYGPKGVGALYVRQQGRRVRLEPQIFGGGQEQGRRSGTMNVPGIVGLGKAIEIAAGSIESDDLQKMTNVLWTGLRENVDNVALNGAEPGDPRIRLPGNLNCQFPGVDGQTLMRQLPQIALSGGSACSAANPEPSHVLKAIGLSDDAIRSSVRFGIGRFNTENEMQSVASQIGDVVKKLRENQF